MKLILCVTLSLILSNLNFVDSSDIGADRELEEKHFVRKTIDYAKESLQKRVQDNSLLGSIARLFGKDFKTNKTRFTDLDRDCVFLILEHLDFDDLLAVARLNDQISPTAASVFRHKYSRFQVDVRYDFEFPEKPSELNAVGRILRRVFAKKQKTNRHDFALDPTIYLHDYESIVDAFKYFGHFIRRLTISSVLKKHTNAAFMGNLISEYISDSLIEFVFEDSIDNLLPHITKPLVNVETVRFKLVNLNVAPSSLPLNELFPAVRRLELDSLKRIEYLNCRMPNLEHVSIKDLYAIAPLENIIMNNPQIKSVDLYNNRPDLVQMMSEHLPQLETLSLTYLMLTNEEIRLESVTKFVFNFRFGSLENLHFPRLQTLQISIGNNNHFAECHKFLNEHNHLKNLLLKHQNLDDSQFRQLTTNLTNLTELTLETGTDEFIQAGQELSSDAIVEFVRSHENVLRLNVINLDDERIVELQEQLKLQWTIKTIHRGVSFERRTNNRN